MNGAAELERSQILMPHTVPHFPTNTNSSGNSGSLCLISVHINR